MNLMVSVIIPVYNEERYIEECIGSILNNDYNDKEIIVVNDYSTDKTKEKIEKYIPKIKVIDNQRNEGIVRSIKIGIDNSIGEIIIKTNADCIVPQDWLKRIAGHFNNKEIVAVSGNYKPIIRNNIIICQEIINDLFLDIARRSLSLSKISGVCWAARKEIINALNLWKENKINDEGNLYLGLKGKGRIIYDKDLIVKGHFPDTLKRVWRLKFYWGEDAVKDRYYKNIGFWLRPLYFLTFILSLIFIQALFGKMLLILLSAPLLIITFFALFKNPLLSMFVPIILLFCEFAWCCGAAKETLRIKLTK